MMEKVIGRDPRQQYWYETTNPALEGRMSALYSLANGYIGLRGTHEEAPSWASSGFYINGAFCTAAAKLVPFFAQDAILAHHERNKEKYHQQYLKEVKVSTIANLPNPVSVKLKVENQQISLDDLPYLSTCERLMHLHEARMTRRLVLRDKKWRRMIIDSERFLSWANRQLICFRYKITPDKLDIPIHVEPFINTDVTNENNMRLFKINDEIHRDNLNRITLELPDYENRIAIAQAYQTKQNEKSVILDVTIGVSENSDSEAESIAQSSLEKGIDVLRNDHIAAVKEIYERSSVTIDTDAYTQQGFNFGVMHLEGAFPYDNPKASVSVKSITGEGYKFVILWDVEFHMLHYYLFTNPEQAKNLILYRYNLLDAARENAKRWGYGGAQYPWESGRSGREEGVPWLILPERELHISADIAYAVKLYDDITADHTILKDYGAEIVFETARFFASRVTYNEEKDRYELRNIGCPDQYHTTANNNAFTNRMVKWNLAYGAVLAQREDLRSVREKIHLTDEEIQEFGTIAEKFYLIQPNEEGIIEEFEGYFNLSTDMRGIGERYCEPTQAVKQADVVLLFHTFSDEYSQKVQQKNWYYYNARTFHGSSLSLPGMALAAARAGLLDQALDNFQRSARMDLDDVNMSTELGVHLAGFAVLWKTVVYGFAGLHAGKDALHFCPRMPRQWNHLSFAMKWHGATLHVNVRKDQISFTTPQQNTIPIPVKIWNGNLQELKPGQEYDISYSVP